MESPSFVSLKPFLDAHSVILLLCGKNLIQCFPEMFSVPRVSRDLCYPVAEHFILFSSDFRPDLVAEEVYALGIETEAAVENSRAVVSQLTTKALR